MLAICCVARRLHSTIIAMMETRSSLSRLTSSAFRLAFDTADSWTWRTPGNPSSEPAVAMALTPARSAGENARTIGDTARCGDAARGVLGERTGDLNRIGESLRGETSAKCLHGRRDRGEAGSVQPPSRCRRRPDGPAAMAMGLGQCEAEIQSVGCTLRSRFTRETESRRRASSLAVCEYFPTSGNLFLETYSFLKLNILYRRHRSL